MNKIILFIVLLTFFAGQTQINSNNLIVFAPFNNTIQDVSGNNVQFMNNGCIYSTDRFGNSFNALNFNGNSYLELNGNQPIIASSDFSVGAWAKMTGNGGGIDSQSTIFEQRDDDATFSAKSTIVLFTQTQSNNAYFIVRSSLNTNATSVSVSTPSKGLNTWHHYFGTKCNDSINFYIDGQLMGSTFYNQTGDFVTSVDYVSIGKHTHTSGQTYGTFEGDIDEFRVYDRCLTGQEVRDIYTDNFLLTNELFNEVYFGIYPNPTKELFMVSLTEGTNIKKIQVIDITGRVINSKLIHSGITELEFLLNSDNGVYYVLALDSNNNLLGQRKLLKQ